MADGEKRFKWGDIITNAIGGVLASGFLTVAPMVFPPVRAWLLEVHPISLPGWSFVVVPSTLIFVFFLLGRLFAPKDVKVEVITGVPEPTVAQATAPVLSDLQMKLLKVIWDAGREITDEEVSRVANVPETVVRATLNAMFPEWVIRNYDYWTPTSTELKEKAVSFAIEQGWPMPSPND